MALLHDRRVRYVLAGGVSSGTYYGVFWIGWLLTAGGVPYLALALAANITTAAGDFAVFRGYADFSGST